MKFNLLSSASTLAMGGLVALALPGAAHAGLVYSALSATETDYGASFLTGGSGTVTVDQISLPAGANLTSVVISEGGSFTSSGVITYTGAGTGIFTYSEIGNMNVTGGGAAGIPTLSMTAIAPSVAYSLASNAFGPYSGAKKFAATTGSVPGGDLSGYIGTGTFLVDFTGSGGAEILGTNSYGTSLNTDFYPSVTITYDFSFPAPEPASLAILGAGLGGLGVLRRRRANKA